MTLNKHEVQGLAFSALLHIFILFAVLCILFLVIVAKLEKQSFNDEINSFAQKKLLPELQKRGSPKLKDILGRLNYDKLEKFYSKESDKTAITNKWLTVIMVICNAFLFILILIVGSFTHNRVHVTFENILTFIIVGLFEYLFFKNVGSKYIPVKPSAFQELVYNHLWSS